MKRETIFRGGREANGWLGRMVEWEENGETNGWLGRMVEWEEVKSSIIRI